MLHDEKLLVRLTTGAILCVGTASPHNLSFWSGQRAKQESND
jgi:hypothetical protein